MEGSGDKSGGDPLGLSKDEVRAVARRSPRGSLKSFLKDMRDLTRFGTLKATVREFQRDDILSISAGLAYYLILALFPFILVLVSMLGTFSSPEFANEVLDYFKQVLPGPVYDTVNTYLRDTIAGNNKAPGLLSFGIIGTIWAASGAFSAFMNAINKAYDVEETRPFWKAKLVAVLMTLGLTVIILVGVLLLTVGPQIGEWIARFAGLDDEFLIAWGIARWPIALLLMMFSVALLYYFAPAVNQPFRWITPGGLVGVLLWVLASVAFNLYVSSDFNTYNQTYGAIGTVIILLLYLYISSTAILFGAELNATLVRLKEEISGQSILDGEPADNKPSVLESEEP